MVLPMMTASLLKKSVILCMSGSLVESAKFSKDPLLKPTEILSVIAQNISDHIILYSPSLISEWNLEPYRHKILIAHRHFLDFETFTVTTPLADRPPLIGYIGRLSGEKGVQHFVQALPAILNDRQDLRVLIGGDGPLKEAIEASLQEGGVTARADLPGWISHDDLPRYLNQLRLLVLPSYTEGLPNIMLEAMACGTPVLATPVGAIPDVIIDGKTGFIMENNSPECIAENVIRALSSPDLEQIAEDGRRFVEE
ncbi:MAG: glycosyltransferase family 4 protein, partial [Bacillota bacterium]